MVVSRDFPEFLTRLEAHICTLSNANSYIDPFSLQTCVEGACAMAQALLWVASMPLVGAGSVLTDTVKSEECIKSRTFVTPDTPALPEAEIGSNGAFTFINEDSATITLCNVNHALSMNSANEWAIEFTNNLLKISALTMVYRNKVNHSVAYGLFFGYTIAVINFTGKAFTTESPTSPTPPTGAPPDPSTSPSTRTACRASPTSPTLEPSAGAPIAL